MVGGSAISRCSTACTQGGVNDVQDQVLTRGFADLKKPVTYLTITERAISEMEALRTGQIGLEVLNRRTSCPYVSRLAIRTAYTPYTAQRCLIYTAYTAYTALHYATPSRSHSEHCHQSKMGLHKEGDWGFYFERCSRACTVSSPLSPSLPT